MKPLLHGGIIAASLFVLLGLPSLYYAKDLQAMYGGDMDAVTGASLEIPDQPSGEYVVLLARDRHEDTLKEWTDFFQERPVGVIFEDLECITAAGDVSGRQMAERYQARLAENQLTLREENSLLAASKAQWGVFDVMVFSKEMADALQLETVYEDPDICVIPVVGNEDDLQPEDDMENAGKDIEEGR